jgi:hypothetical protein
LKRKGQGTRRGAEESQKRVERGRGKEIEEPRLPKEKESGKSEMGR